MSPGGSLWALGITLINYMGDNISKYAGLSYCYNRYRTKNHQNCQCLKFLMHNDDIITIDDGYSICDVY